MKEEVAAEEEVEERESRGSGSAGRGECGC